MKKLALDLDNLEVETFTAEEQQPAARGTVQGHYGTNHTLQYTCTQTARYTYCDGVECY